MPANRLNVLLLTADDMNWNATGALGADVPGVTPHLDQLAADGLAFHRGHVTVAICQPSRQAMMTGRYPHNSKAPGFDPIDASIPTLQERLRDAGYLNGIFGKWTHLAPPEKFCWDDVLDMPDLGHGRDPARYYKGVAGFFQRAAHEDKPFFCMANMHDPHRPFHNADQERKAFGDPPYDYPAPSRVYTADEVKVPDFLPDLPKVREEIAQYYSSCRRCDDVAGQVLKALDEAGQCDNTLVMFLSDNGMAFPFAKTNCYLNSTRTPWLARWPGVITPGSTDRTNFINGIDFAPTIAQLCDLEPLPDTDGQSFANLLRDSSPHRDHLVTHINTIASKAAYPMRGLHTGRYGYIFNAWSDGETNFRNESQSGMTWPAMTAAAERDDAIAKRCELFTHRVPEELFDFEADPHALNNLANDPTHAEAKAKCQQLLLAEMQRSNDPYLPVFEALLS